MGWWRGGRGRLGAFVKWDEVLGERLKGEELVCVCGKGEYCVNVVILS